MNVLEDQSRAYNFIKTAINKNKKLSHAYLIETNGYNNYLSFVKKMIIEILLLNLNDKHNIDKTILQVEKDEYPDIVFIRPDGYFIKKEQVIALEKDFSKKSLLDNKLIYVIDEAEKLNDSSANTILKFLEEPSDGIVAILVAKNRYNVLETILSRCQIISLDEKSNNIDISEENIFNFINNMDSEMKLMTNFEEYYESLFNDKQKAQESLIKLESIFLNYINEKESDTKIIGLMSKYDIDKIIKYILIIEKQKENLKYNLNMKLWFNNLVVEFVEVE